MPIGEAHIDTLERFRDVTDLQWSYITQAAQIKPGNRTGEYRTTDGRLVVDEDGESHISMEDFAIAFVDESTRCRRCRGTGVIELTAADNRGLPARGLHPHRQRYCRPVTRDCTCSGKSSSTRSSPYSAAISARSSAS